MESFLIAPFKIMRQNISLMFIPAIPLAFLLIFLLASGSVTDSASLLERTDNYLGGNIYFSAANLTAYSELSTQVQLPLIRLGGIAESADIRDMGSGSDFLLVMAVLVLGFLSYAMVSRAVYNIIHNETSSCLTGITPATIALSVVASFLMIFISSFALAGFELILTINFGIFFAFSIPYAAVGEPLGESIFKAFKFLSKSLGRVIAGYIGSMGIAIMAPVGLLMFTTPLIVNLDSVTVTNLLKIFLGLFSVMFALFYQMALCATAVFEK